MTGAAGDDMDAGIGEIAAAPDQSRAGLAARAVRRLDRVSLALPMALLLGAALAFAVFALPVRWPLAHARSGIALRLLVALFGGCLGGLPVLALFRRLERPLRAARYIAAAVRLSDRDAPTLRRADAHPDAPPRRPIFAAADLGAPLDAIAPAWSPSAAWGGVPDAAAPLAPEADEDAGAPPPANAVPPPANAADVRDAGAESDDAARPIAATAPDLPPSAPARDSLASASAAALLERLDAALRARTARPVSPGAAGPALRGALEELRRIGYN